MVLNKKGFFFTILILVFVSLVISSSLFFVKTQERKSVQKRIQTLNEFIFSAEEDMQRNVYTAGFRIIFLMEKEITENGAYISSLNDSFNESFFYGTYQNQTQDLMVGATFPEIKTSLEDRARGINLNITMTNPRLVIDQSDPWHVRVTLTTQFYVRDLANLAFWNSTLVTQAQVPIATFEDPLYLVNTNGKISHVFVKTPYTVFATANDTTNLALHLTGNYYKESTEAPSFLDRLQGINTPSVNGVESLVELPELAAQGITTQSKSVVDHIYFSSANPTSHRISGMPSYFLLDDAHLSDYNVAGLTTS